MNKDIAILKKCYCLQREIDSLSHKIMLDRERIFPKIAYSDLPKAQPNPHSMDGRYLAVLDLEKQREEIISEYRQHLYHAEKILQKVEESNLRLFYRLIYMQRTPIWKAADTCFMSERTAYRKKKQAEEAEFL